MEKRAFSIIGGDKRNINLKYLLEEDGHEVKAYGFSKYKEDNIDNCKSLKEAIYTNRYIICGIPFMGENNLITSPFSGIDIKADMLLDSLNKNHTLIAGGLNKDVLLMAKEREIEVFDILNNEQACLLNAIPTAEGVIKIVIEETDTTICGSSVMVIGYGRIGKVLCKMLNGLGAKVFVVVNTPISKAEAESLGYNTIMYEDINSYLPNIDTIVNTVPSKVINKNNLIYVRETSLIIDISSKPFGVDFDDCKNYGVKVLLARSLPGKVAPKSAAIYIRDTIYTIINS